MNNNKVAVNSDRVIIRISKFKYKTKKQSNKSKQKKKQKKSVSSENDSFSDKSNNNPPTNSENSEIPPISDLDLYYPIRKLTKAETTGFTGWLMLKYILILVLILFYFILAHLKLFIE